MAPPSSQICHNCTHQFADFNSLKCHIVGSGSGRVGCTKKHPPSNLSELIKRSPACHRELILESVKDTPHEATSPTKEASPAPSSSPSNPSVVTPSSVADEERGFYNGKIVAALAGDLFAFLHRNRANPILPERLASFANMSHELTCDAPLVADRSQDDFDLINDIIKTFGDSVRNANPFASIDRQWMTPYLVNLMATYEDHTDFMFPVKIGIAWKHAHIDQFLSAVVPNIIRRLSCSGADRNSLLQRMRSTIYDSDPRLLRKFTRLRGELRTREEEREVDQLPAVLAAMEKASKHDLANNDVQGDEEGQGDAKKAKLSEADGAGKVKIRLEQ